MRLWRIPRRFDMPGAVVGCDRTKPRRDPTRFVSEIAIAILRHSQGHLAQMSTNFPPREALQSCLSNVVRVTELEFLYNDRQMRVGEWFRNNERRFFRQLGSGLLEGLFSRVS